MSRQELRSTGGNCLPARIGGLPCCHARSRPLGSARQASRRRRAQMPQHLLPTTVVGSYPQPDWLVNREMLSKSVPRVRMNIWRVADAWLEQAQDDATLLAIRDLERAGI